MKEQDRQDEEFVCDDVLKRYYNPDLMARVYSRVSDLSEFLRQMSGAFCFDSLGGTFSVIWDYVQLIYDDLGKMRVDSGGKK